jgi:hypothetical protein
MPYEPARTANAPTQKAPIFLFAENVNTIVPKIISKIPRARIIALIKRKNALGTRLGLISFTISNNFVK